MGVKPGTGDLGMPQDGPAGGKLRCTGGPPLSGSRRSFRPLGFTMRSSPLWRGQLKPVPAPSPQKGRLRCIQPVRKACQKNKISSCHHNIGIRYHIRLYLSFAHQLYILLLSGKEKFESRYHFQVSRHRSITIRFPQARDQAGERGTIPGCVSFRRQSSLRTENDLYGKALRALPGVHLHVRRDPLAQSASPARRRR